MKKKLLKIANRIIELERRCETGEKLVADMTEIEMIAASLSPEELLEVDNYVSKKLNSN